MTAPTPASLSHPIPSALAMARVHADHAAAAFTSGDEATGEHHRRLSVMFSDLVQAQEAHRNRRETRNLADQVRRLTRALTEEVDA